MSAIQFQLHQVRKSCERFEAIAGDTIASDIQRLQLLHLSKHRQCSIIDLCFVEIELAQVRQDAQLFDAAPAYVGARKRKIIKVLQRQKMLDAFIRERVVSKRKLPQANELLKPGQVRVCQSDVLEDQAL